MEVVPPLTSSDPKKSVLLQRLEKVMKEEFGTFKILINLERKPTNYNQEADDDELP
jgi:hypothetical protein